MCGGGGFKGSGSYSADVPGEKPSSRFPPVTCLTWRRRRRRLTPVLPPDPTLLKVRGRKRRRRVRSHHPQWA